MDKIFETAALIGCLGPYLDSLHTAAYKSSVVQWKLNKNRREEHELGTPEHISR